MRYTVIEAYNWAWIYFVSFVFMGTFVIINLLIAQQPRTSQGRTTQALRKPVTRDGLFDELTTTENALTQLRTHLEKLE